jgi:hypothetical protein
MSKKAAEHHRKASEHLTHAAHHHGEAARHHDAGHSRKGGTPCSPQGATWFMPEGMLKRQ